MINYASLLTLPCLLCSALPCLGWPQTFLESFIAGHMDKFNWSLLMDQSQGGCIVIILFFYFIFDFTFCYFKSRNRCCLDKTGSVQVAWQLGRMDCKDRLTDWMDSSSSLD